MLMEFNLSALSSGSTFWVAHRLHILLMYIASLRSLSQITSFAKKLPLSDLPAFGFVLPFICISSQFLIRSSYKKNIKLRESISSVFICNTNCRAQSTLQMSQSLCLKAKAPACAHTIQLLFVA